MVKAFFNPSREGDFWNTGKSFPFFNPSSTGIVTPPPVEPEPELLEPPVINAFVAVPNSITQGGSAMLSWNITGATTMNINQGVGIVTGNINSILISPIETTTYTLTAVNEGGSVTATSTITVAIPEPEPNVSQNLASHDINDYEIGCWTAQVGTFLAPNNTGSAQFRIRPRQGVIPVPAGSKIRFKTNSPWIFIVRIVGANDVIFSNPAQLHGSNFPDNEFDIQLSSTEVGIAFSLSSLPEAESGTSLEVWEERLLNGDVYPEIYVVDE